MRTTLDLNDVLLAKAKILSAKERTTLTRLIEDGLHWRLRQQQTPIKRIRLPVFQGKGGLMPGINGLNNKAMLEAADHDT